MSDTAIKPLLSRCPESGKGFSGMIVLEERIWNREENCRINEQRL